MGTPPSSDSEHRLPALDGLRGLAIALVMLCHFTSGDLRGPAAHFAAFALSGWIGVDLFFVLSGFLITGILLDSRGSDRYFRAFYARRFLRIFPLYYVALIGMFGAAPFFATAETLRTLRQAGPWLITYTSNVLMAVRGWDALPLTTSIFWSLAVEEQFYLVWPAVVLFAGARRLPYVALGICLAGPAIRLALWRSGALPTAAYVLTPARMDALAVGSFIAVAYRDPTRYAWVWRHARATALASALAIVILMLLGGAQLLLEAESVHLIGLTALATGFGGLLVLGLTPGSARRTMDTPLLGFLGRYSYGLYVLHLPARALVGAAGLRPTGGMLQMVFYAAATGVAIAGALLSWHICEKHFLRLKRFVSYQEVRPVRADRTASRPAGSAKAR